MDNFKIHVMMMPLTITEMKLYVAIILKLYGGIHINLDATQKNVFVHRKQIAKQKTYGHHNLMHVNMIVHLN